MRRKPVESEAIKSVGYDRKRHLLEVEFHSGEVYEYTGVPEEEYISFMNAPSLGQYLNTIIKKDYPAKHLQ